MNKFKDGITSLVNSVLNRRNTTNTNRFHVELLTEDDQRALYHGGIGNKIVRIKAGAALADALQFESEESEQVYKDKLNDLVMDACKYMIAFGRGAILVYRDGEDLTKRLNKKSPEKLKLKVFSGDVITVPEVSTDLMSDRYYKPLQYSIRGNPVHYSRVIDFTYIKPTEVLAGHYKYGGISEFDLIYPQLINDAVIERAIGQIAEKNSSLFYKVQGFKEEMQAGRETAIQAYYSTVEDMRGISGATILDSDDAVEVISQQMTNLSDIDTLSLRRIAMVTGIPLPYLVGEAVQGLNSTGSNERAIFGDMIEALQQDYLLRPLHQLFSIFQLGEVNFIDDQGMTKTEETQSEAVAIDNAVKLASIGEDYTSYLEAKGITQEGPNLFGEIDGTYTNVEEDGDDEDDKQPAPE